MRCRGSRACAARPVPRRARASWPLILACSAPVHAAAGSAKRRLEIWALSATVVTEYVSSVAKRRACMRRSRVLVSAVLLLLSLLPRPGGAVTIATFADPVDSPPPFLFAYVDSTTSATIDGTLTGGFSGAGLDLVFPFQGFTSHPGTTFTITPSVASPVVGDPDGIRFLPVGGLGTI